MKVYGRWLTPNDGNNSHGELKGQKDKKKMAYQILHRKLNIEQHI